MLKLFFINHSSIEDLIFPKNTEARNQMCPTSCDTVLEASGTGWLNHNSFRKRNASLWKDWLHARNNHCNGVRINAET